jgi:hypothetical protein
VLFVLFVVGLTTHWAIQIVRQLGAGASEPGTVACRPGVRALIGAVRAARQAAARAEGNETTAVSQFRTTLGPTWQTRNAVTAACRQDPEAQRALAEIDLWRYAEENAVRTEAAELAVRRRTVHALELGGFGAPDHAQGGNALVPELSSPAP